MAKNPYASQMAKEEKFYSWEISTRLTKELNSKGTMTQADRIMETSGGWPYEPTKPILKLYEATVGAAWKNIESGYDGLAVNISIDSPKGREPSVTAMASYPLTSRGGSAHTIAPGDTLAKLSQKHYGFEGYADQILAANKGLLGTSPKQLPAGFKLTIPALAVPPWGKEAPMCKASWANLPAVKLLYPALAVDWEAKQKAKQIVVLPTMTLEITYELNASFTLQMGGTIDASFNLKSYEAQAGKSIKTLTGAFSTSAKFDPKSGKGTLTLSSKPLGSSMTQKVGLSNKGLTITFGSQKVSTTVKGFTVEGQLSAKAHIKILPARVPQMNPKPVKIPAEKIVFAIAVLAVVVLVGVAITTTGGGVIWLAPALL